MSQSTLMKLIHSRFQNGLFSLKDLATPTTVEMVNSKSQSAFSSDDIVTTELNTEPVDTRVCLLPESSSELVSGLTNTGNSCFLNSILQALSSLPQLQSYLEQSIRLSTAHNLPVTRSLLRTVRLLSTPVGDIINPTDIVEALESNQNVINREQQDAQELYQLLINQLDEEISNTSVEQGLKDLLLTESSKQNKLDNPFNGLLAYRISCMNCGYSSGIPLQAFNNIQLTLPDATNTTLDECLTELTKMEYLTDVECMKCSLQKTLDILYKDIERFKSTDATAQAEKLQNLTQKIEHLIKLGDFESDISTDIKDRLSKKSVAKSKQAMFAKPPKVLCLHFVRSLYLPTGDIVKNTCQVNFPSILDLTPYCTNGTLETEPFLPISTPDPSTSTKYRLMSTVVHYGDHYSGHYIAFKRKVSANQCNCGQCGHSDDITLESHENEWFKLSDDRVTPCETQDALDENPFMLLYELVEEDASQHDKNRVPAIVQKECKRQLLQEATVTETVTLSNIPLSSPSVPLPLEKRKRKNPSNSSKLTIPRLQLDNYHSIPILTQ